MSSGPAEIAFLPLHGDPLRSCMTHAMRSIAVAMGVRLRVLDPERPAQLPERLVIWGNPSQWPGGLDARIQLFLPSHSQDPNARNLTDWIEPGPIPVFGELRREEMAHQLPWSYRGGGSPISWSSRGSATLLRLGFDPLAAVHNWLSLADECQKPWDEAAIKARSDQSRFAGDGLYDIPWMDRLVQFFETLLDLKGSPDRPAPVLERWKNNAPWALALSHDVDMLFKWRFRSVIRLILESPLHMLSGRHQKLADRWRDFLLCRQKGCDPWFLVEEMMDLEESLGLRSTFLFLAEPKDHQTLRYHLHHEKVRELIQTVRERAFEIGLHGGWKSFRDRSLLQQQKGELESLVGRAVSVTRQHWLRFDPRRSWQDHEDCGFEVDGSLGWNDKPGFRAGTSLPFHPWDSQKSKPRRLLAQPLVLMDSQLFDEQQLDLDEARKQLKRILDWVRRSHGLLSVNWHPHVLCERDFPGRAVLYRELLEEAIRDGAQIGGMGELARWWQWRETTLDAACES
jgi:hypothetical protein